MERCLSQFYKILKKDGVVVLDRRNYEKIQQYLKETKLPDVESFNSDNWYTREIIFCGEDVQGYPKSIDPMTNRIQFIYQRRKTGEEASFFLNPICNGIIKPLLKNAHFNFIDQFYDFELEDDKLNPDFHIYVAYKNYKKNRSF